MYGRDRAHSQRARGGGGGGEGGGGGGEEGEGEGEGDKLGALASYLTSYPSLPSLTMA